ncbi:LppU family putative lipoprotein [Rhodococcus zopfii]|uniref:LppU family putative lipoprotein n=1 Tax=Rhodococcus zopfii TaxID=43772 RepID=UPI0011111D53|nr:hypothetical protein [Rhodococcus zopfii]
MGIFRRACAIAAVSCAAVFSLSACGSDINPVAVPESGAAAASTAAPSSSKTTTATSPSSSDADLDIDVEIGDCVNLGGTVDDAVIDNATCGSMESNYKVIDKVVASDECVSDADQTYYETLGGVETGALCLDIDWVVGTCMELDGEDPVRIDCNDPAAEGEKVTEIVQNSDDVNDCATSAGGFVYSERRFVVCTDTL